MISYPEKIALTGLPSAVPEAIGLSKNAYIEDVLKMAKKLW